MKQRIATYKIWSTVDQRFLRESETNSSYAYTLLPYTSHCDSGLVPIYVGDIVEVEDMVGTVEQEGQDFVIHFLGHNKQQLGVALHGKFSRVVGSKYTHMPNGTLAQ